MQIGSYDGAELLELIEIFLLWKPNYSYVKGNIGLYRDDGLMMINKGNGKIADKYRKDLNKVFQRF